MSTTVLHFSPMDLSFRYFAHILVAPIRYLGDFHKYPFSRSQLAPCFSFDFHPFMQLIYELSQKCRFRSSRRTSLPYRVQYSETCIFSEQHRIFLHILLPYAFYFVFECLFIFIRKKEHARRRAPLVNMGQKISASLPIISLIIFRVLPQRKAMTEITAPMVQETSREMDRAKGWPLGNSALLEK